MLKIQKILEKETIMVSHQTHCIKRGKTPQYMDDVDCKDDCKRMDKPTWWECSWT